MLLFNICVVFYHPTVTHAAQRCFSETNQCIDGRIREFWEQNGGLPVFGFPIGSEEQSTVDGKTFTVQRFERNRLELHPENARPYDVLLGRLGADRLAQQGRDWFTFSKNGDTSGCKVFAETGHAVCGAVLNAWRKSGLKLDTRNAVSEAESLALFGLPLSDLQTETLADGKQYQVQWFERARFELHPENSAPYDVLLGLLGNEITTQSVSQTTKSSTVTSTSTVTSSGLLSAAELDSRRSIVPFGYWSTNEHGIQLSAGNFSYRYTIRNTDVSSGKKFVVIAISITNVNYKERNSAFMNPFRLTLIDLEGNSYSHSINSYSLDNTLRSADIFPGYSGGGQLAFEINQYSAPAQLLYAYDSTKPPIVLEMRTLPIQ
jgi:hypothetical protein